MIKLLRAGIRRYSHSLVFWFAIVATAFVSLDAGMRAREYAVDDSCVLYLFLIIAIVINWIVGREAAEGGCRNKIIIGHTKGQLFLSELILGSAFSLVMAVIFFGIFFTINYYVFAYFPIDIIVMMLLNCVLAGVCLTAMLATLCCLITNRIASAIVNMLLVFAMFLGTSEVEHALLQPEYFESYSSTLEQWTDEEGNVHSEMHKIEESIQKTENPAYIAEPLRTVYKIVYRISPYGHISEHIVFTYDWFGYDYRDPITEQSWENTAQQIATNEISEEDYKNVATNILYCAVFSVAVYLIGYLVFRRKDLR